MDELDVIARLRRVSTIVFLCRNDTKRLATAPYQLVLGQPVAFGLGSMRRDLFSCLFEDTTAEDGTIDGDDFDESVAVGAGEEEHV